MMASVGSQRCTLQVVQQLAVVKDHTYGQWITDIKFYSAG